MCSLSENILAPIGPDGPKGAAMQIKCRTPQSTGIDAATEIVGTLRRRRGKCRRCRVRPHGIHRVSVEARRERPKGKWVKGLHELRGMLKGLEEVIGKVGMECRSGSCGRLTG
jgi:hypothetical protein